MLHQSKHDSDAIDIIIENDNEVHQDPLVFRYFQFLQFSPKKYQNNHISNKIIKSKTNMCNKNENIQRSSLCTTINEDSTQESFNSSLQFSESQMSDSSDNSSISFCKLNAVINDNSLSSLSDDVCYVGNRSVTVSNKIGSIKCKIDEMHDDDYGDNDGFDLAPEDQLTFKRYHTITA